MTRRTITLIVAAAIAAAGTGAAVALTAGATPAKHPAAASTTAAPMTCAERYHIWKYGPALRPAHAVEAALRQAAAGARVADFTVVRAAISRLGRADRALSRYPIPRCADPAGYWARVLALLRASADDNRASTGSPMLALVPLSEIPAVSRKLAAELHRTAGA